MNQESEIQSNDSQENIAVEQEQEIVDYKALYEETKSKLDTVAKHKDKLYQETKAAKAERELAKAEAQRIEQEKALKDGEYEKLWQTTKQEKELLAKQIQEMQQANKNEKIQITALRIANELADGDNVELLSEFVQRNLANLADDNGRIESDVIESVKQEFKANAKYRALMKSSKAVGGGAPGNKNSSGESTTMKRDAFEKLRFDKQGAFIKSGGKVID